MFIEKWQNSIKAKRQRYLASRPRPKKVETYDTDPVFKEYLDKLAVLRKNGATQVALLNEEILNIKFNKQIKKEQKKKLIAPLKKELEKAKAIELKNKPKVDKLVEEALALSEQRYEKEYKSVLASNEIKRFKIRKDGKHQLAKLKEAHIKNMRRIQNSTFKDKKAQNIELQNEKNAYDASKTATINATNDALTALKMENYAAYQGKYYYNWAVRDHKHTFKELWGGKLQHFKANFDFSQWITKYALYLIIIAVFVTLVILSAAVKHVNILTGSSILACLTQIAPKIFFSLGVACLILLGGTDLSIGRLTGIGVAFTLMALSSNHYLDNNQHEWINTSGIPGGGRVVIAILLSVGICTLFSCISGFFTAKFKVHSFITTLAVQLISYGFFQIFWSAQSSFSGTPADQPLFQALRGTQSWQLILYAVIAIAVVWFIWNKTKFGKNLYAVGGNQEAAKVSGINPFVITMLAFVMAGILYGLGGFTQAIQVGTGNFNTGYGTETDAIAACVIGGISFTGGIGKVSGAVIGTVILGFLTFAFSAMGLDTNLQLVIKGVIIIAAVTLDCVKYIKKK